LDTSLESIFKSGYPVPAFQSAKNGFSFYN